MQLGDSEEMPKSGGPGLQSNGSNQFQILTLTSTFSQDRDSTGLCPSGLVAAMETGLSLPPRAPPSRNGIRGMSSDHHRTWELMPQFLRQENAKAGFSLEEAILGTDRGLVSG